MKKTLAVLACCFALIGSAQETQKWVFGSGINFIDNSATTNNEFLKTKNWNTIPFISSFSVDRKLENNIAIGANLSMNQYEADNLQNGSLISRDLTYFVINAHAKYTFDQHIVDVKWFDAAVLAGAGLGWLDGENNQFLNTGLTLDFWLSSTVGMRLQTVGKFAIDNDQLFNNHIQHTAEFIFKF
jgi:hypothetical protein